ncbi:MAG: T9SS type A sorting domain-containing protein [Chlorobi bacterium]|nr:T9SS type A sorting domain-containing protein [Chlorobiota bacterium]
MYAVTYTVSSQPYFFTTSAAIGSLGKENTGEILTGRKGVAYIDTAEFYFAFGDVELNGAPVEFEEIIDSNYVNDLTHINQYLRTNPFELSGGNSLVYSVLYGLTDSLFSTQILGEDSYVHFKVELVEEGTNNVIGSYDDITYDKYNLNQYDNISYSINTDGIGTKTVRLKLTVEDNLGGGYGFSKIYAEGSALGKTRGYVELPYQGSLAVEQYALMQNYPNPFNPTTTIKYEIPETGFVTLKIYDVLGREVSTLVNAKREAGRYEAEFNARGLSSGIYIYRIQSGNFTESKKMILLK